jgi:hypothetical protein
VVAHDDPSVGPTNERMAFPFGKCRRLSRGRCMPLWILKAAQSDTLPQSTRTAKRCMPFSVAMRFCVATPNLRNEPNPQSDWSTCGMGGRRAA